MAKIVVPGVGISGHTASAFLKKMLGKRHEVVVISPNQYYQWIPSNIWVGVGKMTEDQVRFPLLKVYDRWGIDYRQAKAVSIHPEGGGTGRTRRYPPAVPDSGGSFSSGNFPFLGAELESDEDRGLRPLITLTHREGQSNTSFRNRVS